MDLDLKNSLTLDNIQKEIVDIIKFDDIKNANNLLEDLERALQKQGELLRFQNGGRLYNIYHNIIIKLKFVLFPNLTDKECSSLLQDSLLEALAMQDYDFAEKIGKKIFLTEREADRIIFTKDIIKSFEKNTLRLGKENLSISGQFFEPTISNWIKDYFSFPVQNSLRSNFDEINYINKGQNPHKLNSEDKSKLLLIIKIFDSLKTTAYEYDSAVIPKTEEDAFRNFDLYKLFPTLDVDEEISNENLNIQPQEVSRPSIPKLPLIALLPRNSRNLKPMGDVGTTEISNNKFQISNVGTESTGIKEINNPSRSVIGAQNVVLPKVQSRVWNQINPGLRMAPPENYQMPVRPKPVEDVQEKIDKKLDELEKRTGGNN